MTKISFVLALVLCLALFAPLSSTAATTNSLAIPVTSTGTGGTFNGVFNLTGFTVQNGQLIANGIVTGTLTNAAGAVTSVLQTVSAAVTSSSGSCTILHLVIGPINLNILGLTVTTNQIVLDISAQPGPGNLLGNLLCDVANLLNNPNQTLANLLNQVVSILRGL